MRVERGGVVVVRPTPRRLGRTGGWPPTASRDASRSSQRHSEGWSASSASPRSSVPFGSWTVRRLPAFPANVSSVPFGSRMIRGRAGAAAPASQIETVIDSHMLVVSLSLSRLQVAALRAPLSLSSGCSAWMPCGPCGASRRRRTYCAPQATPVQDHAVACFAYAFRAPEQPCVCR